MTFRFVSVRLNVKTSANEAEYFTKFEPTLNVIEAQNSWGKSTLIQSLVYGLGLEGSFSASQLSPLGEAMSSVIDLHGAREAVVESSVTLTLTNHEGEFLRMRRFARSLQYKTSLIQTWRSDTEDELDRASRADYFVRQSGGASHELGFHSLLEDFLGWELPTVPGFKGEQIKLYLEVLFPLFYVEQKYGWSGLAPRVPTHYRIRAAYRRAAEFVLGLRSLERIKELDEVKLALSTAQEGWKVETRDLEKRIAAQGWRFALSTESLASGSEGFESLPIEVRRGAEWVPLEVELSAWQGELDSLNQLPVADAGQRTEQTRQELASTEKELRSTSSSLRAEKELLSALESDLRTMQTRQENLEADRTRLMDVRKLRRLGSELSAASLESANCPTCEQNLDSSRVSSGLVMDVEANLRLIDAERTTLENMISTEERRCEQGGSVVDSLAGQVYGLRQAMRAMKDELSGPSNAPSVSEIRRRLELEVRVNAAQTDVSATHSALTLLSARAVTIQRLRDHLKTLQATEADLEDERTIGRFRSEFRRALTAFGLRSLPPGEVTIGDESLLPEHDGFELTFDIHHGMSASDAIRTKWAYYVALARTCRASDRAHDFGFLIMDEPRQQEARLESVRALYTSLAEVGAHSQVIVASSASRTDLDHLLDGLVVNRITAGTPHMLAPLT